MTPTLDGLYYPYACLRCGGEHGRGEILFKEFTNPPGPIYYNETESIQFRYWAYCPANGEPCLLFEVIGHA